VQVVYDPVAWDSYRKKNGKDVGSIGQEQALLATNLRRDTSRKNSIGLTRRKKSSAWQRRQKKAQQQGNDQEAAEGIDDDMPNPMAMMDGMKGQFLFMIQNMVMMQGIGYFFQGYVLVKVPIPLTMGFKMMFQRGLDLSTLETSYVSSVSWYFLVMFGLRAFFRLVIEAGGSGTLQQETQEAHMIQADNGSSAATPSGPGANKFDAGKAIKAELEKLELTKYKGTLDDVEKRLLGTKSYTKSSTTGTGTCAEPGFDIFGVGSTQSSSKRNSLEKKKN